MYMGLYSPILKNCDLAIDQTIFSLKRFSHGGLGSGAERVHRKRLELTHGCSDMSQFLCGVGLIIIEVALFGGFVPYR